MKKKNTFPIKLCLVAAAVILLTVCFFPLFNQQGLRGPDGFLRSRGDGLFTGSSTVQLQDGVLSFSSGLEALTVTEEDGVYTITRADEILYRGKEPDEEKNRYILADGTVTELLDGDHYPVSVGNVIDIFSDDLSIRGNGRYLTIGLAILLIWAIDLLFPNFFYTIDIRRIGNKSAPSPTYRRVQRLLWLLLPLWGLVCLVMAVG
jgi:hypothetical protein